jgi:hypothetical protein
MMSMGTNAATWKVSTVCPLRLRESRRGGWRRDVGRVSSWSHARAGGWLDRCPAWRFGLPHNDEATGQIRVGGWVGDMQVLPAG